MARIVSLIITISWLASSVLAAPTEMISYIQDINVSYTDGQWICGILECPTNTFGCRVQRLTDSTDNKKLHNTYTCFDEKMQSVAVARYESVMHKDRYIAIDVKSYIGAESLYSTLYALGGGQNLNGEVAVDDWSKLKNIAARHMKTVEGSYRAK